MNNLRRSIFLFGVVLCLLVTRVFLFAQPQLPSPRPVHALHSAENSVPAHPAAADELSIKIAKAKRRLQNFTPSQIWMKSQFFVQTQALAPLPRLGNWTIPQSQSAEPPVPPPLS